MKYFRYTLLLIALLVFNLSYAIAAEKDAPKTKQDAPKTKRHNKLEFSACSGGMMIHSGFLQSREYILHNPDNGSHAHVVAKGLPFGMGGAMRAHFGKHLRVGTEGYVSNLYYAPNGSNASLGWGGLLVDCAWEINRWTIFLGGTVGGGSYKNLTLLNETPLDYQLENGSASYRKYALFILNPLFGFEYALTPKVHIVVKMDYLFNVSNPQKDFVSGPRLFFGFMFHHYRKNANTPS